MWPRTHSSGRWTRISAVAAGGLLGDSPRIEGADEMRPPLRSLMRWCGLRSRLRRGRGWTGEVHLWRLARSFGCRKIRVVDLEACPACKDVVGELLDVGVVILQDVVIALA